MSGATRGFPSSLAMRSSAWSKRRVRGGRLAARRSCGHRLSAGGLLPVHLLPAGHGATLPQPEGHRRRQVWRLRRSHHRRWPVRLQAPGTARLGDVGAAPLVRPDRIRRDPAARTWRNGPRWPCWGPEVSVTWPSSFSTGWGTSCRLSPTRQRNGN